MEIHGYTIREEIARGGMATVYLAEHHDLHKDVALKVLLPEFAENLSIAKRFLEEGQIIARLKHPNIIRILDLGQYHGNYYLSMQYLTGGNLKSRIQHGLTEGRILQILHQIATGLQYAHDNQVLHLDLTPQNILYSQTGTPVLTDFGIATQVDELGTQSKIALGNPRYMSPEQIRGERASKQSDLYSLGIIFFEMLTGRVPYLGENAIETARLHLTEEIPRLPSQYVKYQPIIDCLLDKDPKRRYASADTFLHALYTFTQRVQVEADDKTLVFPVQKAVAAGGAVEEVEELPGVFATPPLEEVVEEVVEEFTLKDEFPEEFPDKTDPLSVDEILGNPAAAKSSKDIVSGNGKIGSRQAFAADRQGEIEDDEEAVTELLDLSSMAGHARQTEIDAAGIADAMDEILLQPQSENTGLTAQRDEWSAKPRRDKSTSGGMFSGWVSNLNGVYKFLVPAVAAVLVAFIVINLQSRDKVGSPMETQSGRIDHIAGQTDSDSTTPTTTSPTKAPPRSPPRSGLSSAQEETEPKAFSPMDSPPQEETETGTDLSAFEQTPGQPPAIDVSPYEDPGVIWVDGRYEVSAELETSLNRVVRNSSRTAEGYLLLFIPDDALFIGESPTLHADAFTLLDRLAYICRNYAGFSLNIKDRSLYVDTPDVFRDSMERSRSVADYLLGHGIRASRIRGFANDRGYPARGGVEIVLMPMLKSTALTGNE
jgi:tRNA A-37 threonylcarbamoyl transferase component Bud32